MGYADRPGRVKGEPRNQKSRDYEAGWNDGYQTGLASRIGASGSVSDYDQGWSDAVDTIRKALEGMVLS